ncbi:hypothetical protein EUX98_g285 [Antrodiella citrinella]|uniref:Uncharacterized protein n=1 Tax=Antrodiella citrinella TaxID=2447956 RepID=A0A4S4N6V5_9APHY|nr:hypothetical protein EUX98_g285 [Antrodiella citrinella]
MTTQDNGEETGGGGTLLPSVSRLGVVPKDEDPPPLGLSLLVITLSRWPVSTTALLLGPCSLLTCLSYKLSFLSVYNPHIQLPSNPDPSQQPPILNNDCHNRIPPAPSPVDQTLRDPSSLPTALHLHGFASTLRVVRTCQSPKTTLAHPSRRSIELFIQICRLL